MCFFRLIMFEIANPWIYWKVLLDHVPIFQKGTTKYNSDEEINLFFSPSKEIFGSAPQCVLSVCMCIRVVNLEGRLKGGNDYLNLNTKFLMHARAYGLKSNRSWPKLAS